MIKGDHRTAITVENLNHLATKQRLMPRREHLKGFPVLMVTPRLQSVKDLPLGTVVNGFRNVQHASLSSGDVVFHLFPHLESFGQFLHADAILQMLEMVIVRGHSGDLRFWATRLDLGRNGVRDVIGGGFARPFGRRPYGVLARARITVGSTSIDSSLATAWR